MAEDDIKAPANPEPVNGVFTKDVVIDSAVGVWCRLFIPIQVKSTVEDGSSGSSKQGQAVILFFHGGGFISWSADTLHYDIMCRTVAKSCNAVVVSPNYRLAPQFPCPAAYDDCYKTFDWLRSPDSKAHLPATADFSQCFLLGDSAGGNITHFMGCRAAENDISPLHIRGIVEMQPFFGGEDLTPAEVSSTSTLLDLQSCHDMWRQFLPGQNRDHPNCNVFGPHSPDISSLSLPPILVVTGSLDILKDRDDRFIQKLREMGKDVTALNYDEADHGFYNEEDSVLAKQKDEAIEAVCAFIRSKTHTNDSKNAGQRKFLSSSIMSLRSGDANFDSDELNQLRPGLA